MFWPGISLDCQEEELWSGNNIFSPFLVCALNICVVQLQDMHDMLENVCQCNLQLLFADNLFKEELSEFYSRAYFVIF